MIKSEWLTRTLSVLAAGLTGACGLVDFAGDAKLCNDPPSRTGLRSEKTVVRYSQQHSQSEKRLYLDRVRYLESGDVLSPNRVVVAYPDTPELARRLDDLGATLGDTLLVDTRFVSTTRASLDDSFIADYAGNEGRCIDGAIVGVHALTGVSR
jgi:hypothetical protein